MAFQTSNSSSRRVLSEINVTPLVDVMLVLLIMFMVTAPLMQQGLEVDLPKTTASGFETQTEPFLVVIDAERRITISKEAIALNDLKAYLKKAFEFRRSKELYLQADKKVDYGFVAEAMAEIRSAGIYNIGLITLQK